MTAFDFPDGMDAELRAAGLGDYRYDKARDVLVWDRPLTSKQAQAIHDLIVKYNPPTRRNFGPAA